MSAQPARRLNREPLGEKTKLLPYMKIAFTPTFHNFQDDIERFLKGMGKSEINEHGQMVYHGYQAAVEFMFNVYIKKEAFGPLVAEFRKWNWEWGYNNYLLDLTKYLNSAGNWLLIKELWSAVIAKRKTNYNKTKKARKAFPDKISEEVVIKTKMLLLDSLYKLRTYATKLQHEATIGEYLEMISRVENDKKA